MRIKLFLFNLKFCLLLFIIFNIKVNAQIDYNEKQEQVPITYDEFSLLVTLEGSSNFYLNVLYSNNKRLYINIEDLFEVLNIPCKINLNENNITGFIENENQKYIIDFNNGQIKIGKTIINSPNALINKNGAFYLESSLFEEAFGLILNFNYRSLLITLKSKWELPIVKELKNEKLRINLSKLKGEEAVDLVVKRNYHLLNYGMVDWLLASNQNSNGRSENNFGLGLGVELLYGEVDVFLNYFDHQKFDNRQLNYSWNWVDNDKTLIKQAKVGILTAQTISFLNAPVIGAVIRNTPTTVRKATGYYTIQQFTLPNWKVELYINNVMVDFTTADASGQFIFKVPNVYGYSTIKLKYFGPLGEERSEERTVNVPYTVLPANEFEYGLTAAIVQDSISSRFGKAEFNYGLNGFITIGGGVEYLSSINTGSMIPYAKATIQPLSDLTISSEYDYGVKVRSLLDFYFWSDALIELDYSKFVEGQQATLFNAGEERKAKLSIPYNFENFAGYFKLDVSQFVYKTLEYNHTNLMFSTYYNQFSLNSTTQIDWVTKNPANITSYMALSYRFASGYNIRPSVQYNVNQKLLMSYKIALEKSIPYGYLTLSYEKNLLFSDNLISFNFKYDFPFTRTNISVVHNNTNFYNTESAQGSLAFGNENELVYGSNNSSVGKGGITLFPFLDFNRNGTFDESEHLVKISNVKITGAKVIYNEIDTTVNITNLISFTNYILEFNNISLENISWRFKYKKLQVLIDPNQFKRLDIPVVSVGEASGMTFLDKENNLKGIGRIIVKFYKKDSLNPFAQTFSESDGFIDYMGFEPGEYVASLDSVQLSILNLTSNPTKLDFIIQNSEEGDIVSGLDFILKSNKVELLPEKKKLPKK